jgi:hypothetical protein
MTLVRFLGCGVLAVAALTLGALAAPAPSFAAPGGPVGAVCAGVVGLSPGEKHYAACVQSLSHSLAALRRGEGVAAARARCLARGLAPGSAALAECELAAAPAAGDAGPPGGAAVPGGVRSYFEVSHHVAFQRDQLACARLGFEPASGSFDDCVADLRAALSSASTSMM